MSSNVVIAISVALAVSAAFLAAWVGRRLWLRRVRRLLVSLFGKNEAVRSAVDSLASLMQRLAEADDDAWVAFATDPDSEERRALGEVGHRMEVVAVELAATPLPRVLHELAEDIERVARDILQAATSVEEASDAEAVIAAVSSIQLDDVTAARREAEAEVARLKAAYRVTDAAVYGGGLYI